ncbi:TPA: helix-turn-helix domain-containing protein [Escherichia coli]|uniref:phage repressor protein CI n=1 Tax=Enterobacteriaceae TaxID=543 RepID=UPI000DA5DE20|nr:MULTISPECIES: helix-turn-helix domain-containing protein [Enterobacteriaceae]HBX3730305.1 phage repressor protein [Klebsiella pneumoniae subsp. pneumoniae]MBC4894411.1 helix-turn-helix domain-containing protein [Klebsiella pneumoniae]MCD5657112.1 helix-turn-helix domain-containing protein [Klebsiella pneumoniae]MCE4002623.1 helix-turn-helix domain-containing protein [Escherichia coli]MCP5806898.1 helix-turn-helix domain-containing protein [Klebsiella pneumoniae]
MSLIKAGNDSGGRDAINRLIKAYNFSSRQQLCEHLEVSKSTMANRYLRDSFPAEWVIQCALETGASLLWLATGQGDMYACENEEINLKNEPSVTVRPLSKIVAPSIKRVELKNGELQPSDEILLDSSLLDGDSSNALFVKTANDSFVVDTSVKQVSNGFWLVDMDGVKSIVKIARIPGNKIVVNQDDTSFECSVDDVEVVGRAVKVIKNL